MDLTLGLPCFQRAPTFLPKVHTVLHKMVLPYPSSLFSHHRVQTCWTSYGFSPNTCFCYLWKPAHAEICFLSLPYLTLNWSSRTEPRLHFLLGSWTPLNNAIMGSLTPLFPPLVAHVPLICNCLLARLTSQSACKPPGGHDRVLLTVVVQGPWMIYGA